MAVRPLRSRLRPARLVLLIEKAAVPAIVCSVCTPPPMASVPAPSLTVMVPPLAAAT